MPASHKSINLIPRDSFDQTLFGRTLDWALSIGRYIVIITELAVVITFFMRFQYDMKLADIREKIKNNQDQIVSFQDMESQFRFLQARTNTLKEIDAATILKNDVYREIGRVTPEDVYYTSLRFDRGNLSLQGVALNDVALVTLLNQLKSNQNFSQAVLGLLSSKGAKDPQLDFAITAKLIVRQ